MGLGAASTDFQVNLFQLIRVGKKFIHIRIGSNEKQKKPPAGRFQKKNIPGWDPKVGSKGRSGEGGI